MESKKQEEKLVKSFNVDNVEMKSNEKDFAIVKAYVSIFNNIDRAGDMIVKGAFTKSLENKLPKVCWCHEWSNVIGKVISAEEDNKGLLVEMQITKNTQQGAEAIELMKMGAMDEFSIGYQVNDYEIKSLPDGRVYNELKELELFEVSPVLVGCNPDTKLVSIKSDENIEIKEEEEKNDPQNCDITKENEECNDMTPSENEEKEVEAPKVEEIEETIKPVEEEDETEPIVENVEVKEGKIYIRFADNSEKSYNTNIKNIVVGSEKSAEDNEAIDEVKVDKKTIRIIKTSLKTISKITNDLNNKTKKIKIIK